MFNKEQVYFLGDFLADSLSEVYEEIAELEEILENEKVIDDEIVFMEFTENLEELKNTYVNLKELIEVTRNWKKIFT